MSKITWKNRGYAGIDGYVDGVALRAFLIYDPTDPCNRSRSKGWELRTYLGDAPYSGHRSYHPNLAAAKRAADRRADKHLGIKRPRVRREQPKVGLRFIWNDLYSNVPGITGIHVAMAPDGTFTAVARDKPVGSGYTTVLEAQLAAEAYHFSTY